MADLARASYVNLATYRRAGGEVRTPVWAAGDPSAPARLWVYTNRHSGKVKRIRRDGEARVAACDVRGNPRGAWYAARATLVEDDAAQAPAFAALEAKYGWQMRLLRLAAQASGRWNDRIILAVDVLDGAPAASMRELAPDLWVVEREQAFYGLEVGTRMTVIRLADGSLLLHSPVVLDGALRAELDAKGAVRFVVAPNRVHHLYAGRVAEAYPAARLWVAPGLERKRPDLAYTAILGDEAPAEWRDQVDQCFFRGRPYENEVTFFHRASRTLLLCDLAFNFGPEATAGTRGLMWLIGSYDRFGPSSLDPWLIRDRAAARASLERILAWDFDRVIVSHGRILETGGNAALRHGYRWLFAD